MVGGHRIAWTLEDKPKRAIVFLPAIVPNADSGPCSCRTPPALYSLAQIPKSAYDLAALPGAVPSDGIGGRIVVMPCSLKILAMVRIGFRDDLTARSANICLTNCRWLLECTRDPSRQDLPREQAFLFLSASVCTGNATPDLLADKQDQQGVTSANVLERDKPVPPFLT